MTNPCRMGQLSQADRAPLSLVAQNPTQTKQADQKRRYDLDVLGRQQIDRLLVVRQIYGDTVDNRQEQSDFAGQKAPSPESRLPRNALRTGTILSERKRGSRRQGQARE